MSIDAALAQARPVLKVIGAALIVAALCKFAGLTVPIRGAWWELGLAGYLAKAI